MPDHPLQRLQLCYSFEKYDKNPVSVVPQEATNLQCRDRFRNPKRSLQLIRVCEENNDPELKAFLILAPTTGMRKGEILSRKWSDIDLDSGNPCLYVRKTKNDEPKRIQLPATWPSPLSARYQASAITNTSFLPSPTHDSKASSKDRTHGILGSGGVAKLAA